MAVTFDNVCADTFSVANVGSLTSANWTIGGANRAVVGFMGAGAGTRAVHSEMRWRGSAGELLTQVGTSLDIGANNRLSAWARANPTIATDTAFGLYAANQDETAIGMLSYTGVDQASPTGTPVTATGTTDTGGNATATVNVATAVGDMVVAGVWVGAATSSNPSLVAAGGATLRYDITGTQLGFEGMAIVELVATGTTTTMSVTISSGGNTSPWGIIAFVIKAAVGGGIGARVSSNRSPARRGPRRPQFQSTPGAIADFAYPVFTTEGLALLNHPRVPRGPLGITRFRETPKSTVGTTNITYTQSISGVLTFSGVLQIQTSKLLAGGLTFSGSLQKQTNKILDGVLSFSGALQKQTNKILNGVLSFVGGFSANKVALLAIGGVLSFVGDIQKQTNKVVGGTLTFTGLIQKQVNKIVAGTLSFSGALVKLTQHSLDGALSFSGGLVTRFIQSKVVTGTLSFAGSLAALFIPGGGGGPGTDVHRRRRRTERYP